MIRPVESLAMGLVCLLSLAVARGVRADDPPSPGAEAPATQPHVQRVPGALTTAPPVKERLIIPPYVRDKRGDVTTRAVFPLGFGRKGPDLTERLVLPYYYRRSPELDADVAAGLIWSLRGPDRNTFVLPPLYTHRKADSWALGLFPLFSTGVLKGHHHTIIPPLLTWVDGDEDRFRLVIGPYFDFRKAETNRTFRGLFPLVWSKRDDTDRFLVAPPLFFHFADDDPLDYTTVIPPLAFFHMRNKERTAWGLVPIVFHKKTDKLTTTTIPLSLFQFGRGPGGFRLITPLFAHIRDENDERLTITPLYQRKRGDRNLDGVAPFFFHTWDDRDLSRGWFIPPIYWNWRDPANDTTVVFPVFGRRYRAGIKHTWATPLVAHAEHYDRNDSTWWVFPTFHYGETDDGFQLNLHPLFYLKRSVQQDHSVLAPIWFDFEKREQGTRRSVGFPVYWDFRDQKADSRTLAVVPPLYFQRRVGTRTRTFVLNSFHERVREGKHESVRFHFAPFFAFGRSDRGRWWNILLGLAGYERRGSHRRAQVFYMNFDLDD